MPRILAVDDEPADLNLVRRALEKQAHEVLTAETAKEALRRLRKGGVDVVVVDVMLPDGNGLDVLQRIREVDEHLPVILVTAGSNSSTTIQAMKLGALDYLLKPINVTELRRAVEHAVEIRRLTDAPVEVATDHEIATDQTSSGLHGIIGRCPSMQAVYKSIGIVAGQDVTVLIRGESGTGKELVARALYQFSDRVQGPFVAVNCAAIPETLLESELFGHEKGAFTGADRKRIGKFEQCAGGTLFLDEIGDMSPVLQSKLLRVLQEKQFERVGGNEPVKADVRVIAATHRRLEEMVTDGRFRADLYYRINGFTIHLPPLRARGSDLDLLVDHFRRQACRDMNKDVRVISPDAMDVLRAYHWPGNIRELHNAVRQAVLKATGPALLPDFLPELVHTQQQKRSLADSAQRSDRSQASDASQRLHPREGSSNKADAEIESKPVVAQANALDAIDAFIARRLAEKSPHLYDDVIGDVEQRLVRQVLERTDGDKTEAARRLGVNPVLLRSRAALELDSLKDDRPATPLIRPGMTMAEIEAEAIRRALRQTDGCRKQAAELLGISTRTMQRRVKELKLEQDHHIGQR